MFSETFELSFYNCEGQIDSVQQYRTEAEAREAMNYFKEPDSEELYSKITLTKTVWSPNTTSSLLDSLSF